MIRKKHPDKITPEQEAAYIAYATIQLMEVRFTLDAFAKLCEKCAGDKAIQEGILRCVIVQYGSVFKGSNVGNGKTYRLDKQCYVPKEHKGLHDRLIDCRDKLVAHLDFDFRKPEKAQTGDGTVYYTLAKSPVFDLTDSIAQIRDLTEKVSMILVDRYVALHQNRPEKNNHAEPEG
jgi:hypothetical protein